MSKTATLGSSLIQVKGGAKPSGVHSASAPVVTPVAAPARDPDPAQVLSVEVKPPAQAQAAASEPAAQTPAAPAPAVPPNPAPAAPVTQLPRTSPKAARSPASPPEAVPYYKSLTVKLDRARYETLKNAGLRLDKKSQEIFVEALDAYLAKIR